MLTLPELLHMAQPMRTGTGVYLLLRGETVVYVGQSTNVVSRVARHTADKSFDSFVWIPCRKSELRELELDYIDFFIPEYNGEAGRYHREVALEERARKKAIADAEKVAAKEAGRKQRQSQASDRAARRNAFLAQPAEDIERQLKERMAYLRALRNHPTWPSPFELSAAEIRAKLDEIKAATVP